MHRYLPTRPHADLDKLAAEGECILCTLTHDLFDEPLGLGDADDGGGEKYGGGAALAGGRVDTPPPSGPPLGVRRRPDRFEDDDNRFALVHAAGYAYCADCLRRFPVAFGQFVDARIRKAAPTERAELWASGEVSGEWACEGCWIVRLNDAGIDEDPTENTLKLIGQYGITVPDDPRLEERIDVSRCDLGIAPDAMITETTPLSVLLVDLRKRPDLDPRKTRRLVPSRTDDNRFGLTSTPVGRPSALRFACDRCKRVTTWTTGTAEPPGCFVALQRRRKGLSTMDLPRRGQRSTKHQRKKWPGLWACTTCWAYIWDVTPRLAAAILLRHASRVTPRPPREACSETDGDTDPDDLDDLQEGGDWWAAGPRTPVHPAPPPGLTPAPASPPLEPGPRLQATTRRAGLLAALRRRKHLSFLDQLTELGRIGLETRDAGPLDVDTALEVCDDLEHEVCTTFLDQLFCQYALPGQAATALE